MKKLLCILLLTFTMGGLSMAQSDSTATDSTKGDKFKTELTLSSRNLYRGVSFGNSPSIQMMGAYMPCNYFEVGTYGQATLNGVTEGYGNQLNIYAAVKYNKFSLTFDDFFFFNADDDYNNYFEYRKDSTQHYMEARLKYDSRLDLTATYTFYQNSAFEDYKGMYLEAAYDVTDNFNVSAGYVTDKSAQMFYDKAGVTSVGVTFTRQLKTVFSPVLKTSLIASPNYKNVSRYDGVGHAPVYLVASLTF